MITLRFKYATITLTEEAEQARGRRIDFSKFGEFLGGEGEGWEYVILGAISITDSPDKYFKKRPKIQEAVFDDNERLEFPLDLINPKFGKAIGFHWYDGEFERSNYDDKIVASWNDIEDYDKDNILHEAENMCCKEIIIGKNVDGTKFFVVGFAEYTWR